MSSVQTSYPLSDIQKGMVFHSLKFPHSGVYIQQLIGNMQEELDLSAFSWSIRRLLQRYPNLRIHITFGREGEPLQVVNKTITPSIIQRNWVRFTEKRQALKLQEFLQTDRQKGFNLEESPLMRFALFRIKDDHFKFVWTSHHLLFDGRSRVTLLRELCALYQAKKNGTELELPNPVSYWPFIDWLKSQNFKKHQQAWTNALVGIESATPLSIDLPKFSTHGQEGSGTHSFTVSKTITAQLIKFCQQCEITLNTLLIGAWALILSRYSGHADVVFGVTRTGRSCPIEGIQNIVGLCINTLPMKVNLPRQINTSDWLKTIRKEWVSMRSREQTPLTAIQSWSQIAQGEPLFESLVVFEHQTLDSSLRSHQIDWPHWQFHVEGMTNFPLVISGHGDQELRIDFTYHRHCFALDAIERLAGHFHQVLQEFHAHSQRSLDRISLLSPREAQEMMVEWDTTFAEYPMLPCIHDLFESQAALSPEAIAIEYDDTHISYQELNRLANRLAQYLRNIGVQPETPVGLLMERSTDLIVGLLGILKAGGTYIPLDPAYPKERILFMLQDSHTTILLTHAQTQQMMKGDETIRVVDVTHFQSIQHEGIDRHTCQSPTHLHPSNLAYILYTSGSTGRPKGVAIEHRNVVNFLHWVRDHFTLKELDAVLASTSICFDLSIFEIFGPLSWGGTVILVKNALHLQGLPNANHVTLINTVPSAISALLHTKAIPESVLTINLAGEPLTPELVTSLYEQTQVHKVHDLYGPSEATTYSTGALRHSQAPSTIGRPLLNMQTYVLDATLHPVPIQIASELYIGGEGLARGYWQQPSLTAEKFVPDHVGQKIGTRLYRTGDLVRHRVNGELEFLGRIDHQVKIRGHRVELGEIQEILGKHEHIRENVVIIRTDLSSDPELVAYIVVNQNIGDKHAQGMNTRELQEFLSEQLPSYMIPGFFMFLDRLPLTPNGKIDRKALPKPTAIQTPDTYHYIPPRTKTESLLADMWAQVLRVEQVGIADNFFSLGGHSLLAMQIVARIRTSFNVELPLQTLFDTPTVSAIAEIIDHLNPTIPDDHEPILGILPRPTPLPLSYAQERLWFLDRWEPNSPLYNMAVAYRLHGTIHLKKWEHALRNLIQRHETLRTIFIEHDGVPTQVIHKEISIPLTTIDLSGKDPEDRAQEATHIAFTESRRPFNLSTGPLVRSTLISLNKNEHLFLLTLHHIISDGWSLELLFRELLQGYQAELTNQNYSFPPLQMQYADFAIWQREWLQGKRLNEHLVYWRNQLGGAPPMLQIPTDYPRPAVPSYHGRRQPVAFSAELAHALHEVSEREGVTLFMVMLAAFQLLLARYTGQKDIVVGSPIANRSQEALEPIHGFFANTLVLRTDLSGQPTFQEVVRRVRNVCLGAYAHQDVPFEKLVEELQPERDLSRNPLFQVMFQLYTPHDPGVTIPDLTVSRQILDSGTAKFDLLFSLGDRGSGLYGGIEYATDLFEESTITRFVGHYQRLLEEIILNSTRRVDQLSLLTPAEETQLLVKWNATQTSFPQHFCVHNLVEEQVKRTPDSIAVQFDDQVITYSQLNHQADAWARHLQNLGVGPDVRVGVCLERSIDLLITVLGILKAGGAYVPLDPTYPQTRLDFMLSNGGVSVLVSQRRLADLFATANAHTVFIDEELSQIPTMFAQVKPSEILPTNMAYIIYTSGSTGQPKGVAMPHHALGNLIAWQMQQTTESPRAATLQYTSLNFDVSAQEIFSTLGTGGTLVMVSETQRQEPVDLMKVLMTAQVERLFLPVVALHQLTEIAEAWDLWPTSLREICTAGEALQITPALKQFFEKLPHCTLHNHYGPTETHVSTTYSLEEAAPSWADRPPIGRPIANERTYIFDELLQPVPIGVTGELFLGGTGLARGYVNRADLTAERFVPNPYAPLKGERLYKTGDLGLYRSNGVIDFVGRRDHQIKLRGYRIEVGEIEAGLELHPSVSKAVVAMYEEQGHQQLVAYVISTTTTKEVNPTELHHFLEKRLPAYMLPTAWVSLETLPLTPTGKINRQALPAPGKNLNTSQNFVSVQNPEEEKLAEIWKEVLSLEQIGRHDNFFTLGGHSLLAMKLLSRIRKGFGVELPIRSLFEAPTIEALSVEVGKKKSWEGSLIRSFPRKSHMPLSMAQERLWFLHESEPASSVYNLSSVVRAKGVLLTHALQHALDTLIARHETLRTRFNTIDGLPVQIIQPTEQVPLNVYDLQTESDKDAPLDRAQEIIQNLAVRRFDLCQDSLIIFSVLKIGPEEHLLSLTTHHIIFDGWSIDIFWQDLGELYTAHVEERSANLPSLPLQYADFSSWQRECLKDGRFRKDTTYWCEQLPKTPSPFSSSSHLTSLQTSQSYRTAQYSFFLSSELTKAFKEFSQQQNVTLFIATLAAWKLLLARHLGHSDIVVGIPIAGRTHEDLERIIGMFVNVLVLKTPLSWNLSFHQFVERVHHVFTEGYAHQNMPFGKILEELHVERVQLFDLWFNFSRATAPVTSFTGLTVSKESCIPWRAKYGLALYVSEESEGFYCTLVSQAEKFSKEWLTVLASQFQSLVRQLTEDSRKELWSYSLFYPNTPEKDLSPHLLSKLSLSAPVTDSQKAPPQDSIKQLSITPLKIQPAPGHEEAALRDFPSIRSSKNQFKVSFAQERLWFLEQWEPQSALYNVATVFRLRGLLHLEAFRNALQSLVLRHDSLRTTFQLIDDLPCQCVHQPDELGLSPLSIREVHSASPETQETSLQQMIAEETHRPFDLSRAPLFRVQLLPITKTETIFILTMHHIITDGWSLEIFLKELATFYATEFTGTPVSLLPLPMQYANYARWQREWLQGDVLANQLRYWRAQLEGAPPILELPMDYPRPLRPSHQGAKHHFVVTAELTRQLRTLSQQQGASLFMTLLAIFQVFLARYTGQTDIIVGSPIANRTHEQSEGLIGFLVNTLLFRTHFRGNPNFREVLTQVKNVCLDAYAHQDLPFEKLVEELQPERNLGLNPLFQVMLQLQNMDAQTFTLPGLEIERLPNIGGLSKFDLNLFFIDNGRELQGIVDYSADLFTASTITRMMTHFQRLMKTLVEQPEQPVFSIALLTDAERQQQLVEWNNTTTTYPNESCVHHLFEAQVARTPDAIAVVYDSQSLTFRELNEKANQLALLLQHQGVFYGTIVPIIMERSVELIISYFAIMKVGAAFCPMDPEWPTERLKALLTQIPSRLVLINKESVIPNNLRQNHVFMEVEARTLQGGAENLHFPVSPDTPIYTLFTSGSTGIPKGAMNHHRGIVNRLWNMQQRYSWSEEDVVLVTLRHTFDASLWQYLWALTHGARVILPPASPWVDMFLIRQLIDQEQVTITGFVPSVFSLFVDEVEQQKDSLNPLPPLRHLLIGGEALQAPRVNQFRTCCPRVKISNAYGPTEASISTIYYEVPHPCSDPIPIGRPLKNVKALILDNQLNLVPVGVPGELHLGGICVGYGYSNNPEATLMAFIPNPFPELKTAILYKTGDRASFQPDGTIRYLGRRDHQVKINGVRMELGEIETILQRHPEIKQALVLPCDTPSGGNRLVAYLIPISARTPLENSEITTFLSRYLPKYMVPSTFILLEQFPLLPNGKVNRRSLPPPVLSGDQLEEFIPPQTPAEEHLAEIFKEILKVEQVGRHDNFFTLGGHSLLAMIMVSRIKKAFGTKLEIRVLFDRPTIQELAIYLETAGDKPTDSMLLDHSQSDKFPASFAQQRLWFLDQWEPNSPLYNIPKVYRLIGILNNQALNQALSHLVSRHDTLRTTFISREDLPYQSIAKEVVVNIIFHDLKELASNTRLDRAHELFNQEAERPFQLDQGPLFRVMLIQLSAQEHWICLTLHHIIADGWSMEILWRELGELYGAYHKNQRPELPPLLFQYKDFSQWERRWAQESDSKNQLMYWRQKLRNVSTVLDLPTDFPRPRRPSYCGGHQRFSISRPLTDKLRTLCQQEGLTMFMLLMGAFQILLYRYSGQQDFVVGTPVARRPLEEVEGLIGLFINTLLIRSQFERESTFRDVALKLKDTCLDAYANKDLPFENLIEELQSDRDPSRNPLFQVLFHLYTPLDNLQAFPGLVVSEERVFRGTAKVDLAMTLIDQGTSLQGSIEFATDLFEPRSIDRFIEHFMILLEEVTAKPREKIDRLPLLSHTEQQLLQAWNRTSKDYPRNIGLHDLVQQQGNRTPDAIALVCEEQQVSYQTLIRRANQLAHYLLSLGVQPEDRVGLCHHRSTDLIVGLIGIMQAGGSYLPLDPQYPLDRLRCMTEDAQVKVVVTEETLEALFPQESIITVLLDRDCLKISNQSETKPKVSLSEDSLAYVLYTSGSTGHPKGVQISHKNVVNCLLDIENTLKSDEPAIVLTTTSISFDISILELFSPLAFGGRIILASQTQVTDGHQLAELISLQSVTKMQATPAGWRLLIDANWKGKSDLIMLSGGEALSQELANQLHQRGKALWNLYGPSETTIYSTCTPIHPMEIREITIGSPIANTQTYILNTQNQLMPIGIPGELYIGGEGLSRGYLYRPDLTAEKFSPDPFSQQRGSRLYRTGDRARYRANRKIEWLGRLDYQIKLRGFRIELGEIEKTLLKWPTLTQAVVVIRQDSSDNPLLVAYFRVIPLQLPPSIGELHVFMREQLPEYMIPNFFVQLDQFPLTPNGKINRKELPPPEIRSGIEQPFEPAHTQAEKDLSKIWSKVLGSKVLGRRDNFFELGGNSLLAMQVISQVRKVFNVEIFVRSLFEAPTLETFATTLSRIQKIEDYKNIHNQLILVESTAQVSPTTSPTSSNKVITKEISTHRSETDFFKHNTPLICLQPNGALPPFFCVHPVGGGITCYQELAKLLGKEQPFYALQALDWLSTLGNDPTLEEIASHYVQTIKTLDPLPPYYLGGWSMGGVIAYEMARQLETMGNQDGKLFLFDSFLPQDLETSHLPNLKKQVKQFWENLTYEKSAPFPEIPQIKEFSISNLHAILKAVLDIGRQQKVLPWEMEFSHFQQLWQIFSSLQKAYLHYSPEPSSRSITLFQAEEHSQEKIKLAREHWEKIALGGVQVYQIAGNHYSIFHPSHIQNVASRLQNCLRHAQKFSQDFPPSSIPSKPSINSPLSSYFSSGPSPISDSLKSLPKEFRLEHRSLTVLIEEGEIPKIDAVALYYLPDAYLKEVGLTRNEVINGWYGNQPTLTHILDTSLGRVGLLMLPRTGIELYSEQEELLVLIQQALEISSKIGATTASLTGLLPSATNYGLAIQQAIGKRMELPRITTGHGTTAATVVLALQKILREGQRDIQSECMGYLGLGSIGMASLRLMLSSLPHPKELLLCDLYHRKDTLEAISHEVATILGFRGNIQIVKSTGAVPSAFYKSSLVIGATNVPDVLDVDRLQPGTLIVDDSGPHCFKVEKAIQRSREYQDILFTEGGILESPISISCLRYIPRIALQQIFPNLSKQVGRFHSRRITGCILSSLLLAKMEGQIPVFGMVDVQTGMNNFNTLLKLGYDAAELNCEGYTLPPSLIQNVAGLIYPSS